MAVTPIKLVYPNHYAMIVKNPGSKTVNVHWLGETGLKIRSGETVAIIGNPLVCPDNPQRYDAKKDIISFAKLFDSNALQVLSLPGNPVGVLADGSFSEESLNFFGADGVTVKPNYRIFTF